jgi:hypothetical protein
MRMKLRQTVMLLRKIDIVLHLGNPTPSRRRNRWEVKPWYRLIQQFRGRRY